MIHELGVSLAPLQKARQICSRTEFESHTWAATKALVGNDFIIVVLEFKKERCSRNLLQLEGPD